MLWFSALLVLLLTGCGAAKQVRRGADEPARNFASYAIGFYNVENLWHPSNDPNNPNDVDFTPEGPYNWTMPKYERKLDNIARVINNMGKDHTPYGAAFIGVAEVENRQVLEDLVQRPMIANLGLKVVHGDSPDRRGIDVGALYNPNIFQLIDYKLYRYPKLEQNPNFTTRDQLRVTGLVAGEKIHVIVMHWPSRYGGKESDYLRTTAAELTLQIMNDLYQEDPEAKIIIMGDLNDDPSDISVIEVLQAKENRNDVPRHGIYNPGIAMHRKGLGTLVYQNKWNFFDQIMVNSNLLEGEGLRYWKMEILSRDFLIKQEGKRKGWPFRAFEENSFIEGYSDHFPVLIYLIKEL